jgi:hypothetical protein
MAAASMIPVMLEKLDLLVRFWELIARHAEGGSPLSAGEQVELMAWLRLITTDRDEPAPGPLVAPGADDAFPAQVIGAGTSSIVELRGVLSRVLLVTSAAPLAVGTSVLLRAADAVAAVEYVVPCVVKWVHYASPCSAALAVDGVPARKAFGPRADPAVMQAWAEPERQAAN